MPPSRAYRLAELYEITSGPSGQQLEGLATNREGVPVISPPDLTAEHKVDPRNIKRVGFGCRRFAHYRIRVLLYAGKPNWDLLATVTPR